MAPQNGFRVTPDTIAKIGEKITDHVDEVHASLSSLSGTSQAASAYTTGLTCAKVLAECETAWERATDVALAKLATAADNLKLCAQDYTRIDGEVARKLPPR